MLTLETARHPMHIASLQIFEPPADAGPGFVEQIFAKMRACTDVATVFTGHPRQTRRGTSAVRWSYDTEIDLDDHLEMLWLPAPGGDTEFFRVLSGLHSGLLDRTRPLWRATVIGGLEGGRFAVYTKTHHALLDGVSGMRMLHQSLSTDPEEREVRASWARQPASPAAPAARPAPRSRATRAAGTARAARRSASAIRAALRERELFPVLRAPRTMFNAPAGGERSVAVRSWPMARITDVAKAVGVSPNDVSVAMISGALREYLTDCDALPDTPMLGMLPVSMRTGTEANERNIFGSAVCNLGTHLEDPVQRLRIINRSMDYNKRFIRSLPQQVAIHLAGLICAPVGSGRIPPVFNVSISQVPAPREALYRGGARLLATYALAPTLSGQALNFGLISDGENVTFSAVGNTATVPGLARFLDLFETALKDLERAAGL
ncbi:wax ester/triacylglycerol synthase family O-acyltransferase [Mycobacterium sp. NPDC050041]|uniref:wax ester/triacylglycerol synthase family O-acyltransferase n=1 Tax=Mycobacterium sp. NPDC050041 TaxID=3364293 RepID=UPI003C2B6A93